VASRVTNRTSLRKESNDSDTEIEDRLEESDDEVEEDEDTLAEDGEDASTHLVSTGRSRGVTTTSDASITQKSSWVDFIAQNKWIPMRLRNSIIELTKVTWPSGDDVRNLTLVVFGLLITFSILFGLFDIGLGSILKFVVDKIKP
jgi:preprotein translocase SecE subunit